MELRSLERRELEVRAELLREVVLSESGERRHDELARLLALLHTLEKRGPESQTAEDAQRART
ncbi:MAG: hypothetical protein KF819_31410 [Labilithrix sp.]|nr:hypothetical protein [Labilithrix sp.]